MELMKSALVPLVLGFAVYYAIFGGEHSVFEVRAARAAVGVEEAELGELRAEIESLRARTDSLEHDPATIERVARERFGMVREGETLYRFVIDSTFAPTEPEPER